MEKEIDREVIFKGNILNIEKYRVKLIDNTVASREVARFSGAVAVVLFNENNIVLVEQFRFPVGKRVLEIPAGRLENEDPVHCATREVKEETGYSCRNIDKLTEIYTSPGFSDEVIHIFRADVKDHGEPQPDPGEFVDVIELSVIECLKRIKNGEIKDSKTIAGILFALKLKEGE
ncbi:MAG: NUDIX hydrolase [Kosmotoga sp.]|nr:MAG: NUDIX hydrolase [Kosmotoga sp.]